MARERNGSGAWLLGVWLAAGAALGGCEPGDPAATGEARVAGTVLHRERIALPADATVEVRIEDVSLADAPAMVLAQQTIPLEGRQVPVPFEVTFPADSIEPNHRYGVRASIRAADGALLFTTTDHHPVLKSGALSDEVEVVVQRAGSGAREGGGAATEQRGEQRVVDPGDGGAFIPGGAAGRRGAPETGRTLVYDCDPGTSFVVRTGPGEVALWLPETLGGLYLVLSMDTSGAGRYVEGEIALTFAPEAEDAATLEVAGRTFPACSMNRGKVPWADAARRGVTFRALGNEPSWSLEITADRLTMITELGQRRTELPYTEPEVTGTRTTYRAADNHDLLAVVDRVSCTDTMSGEAFEATASVSFEGTTYHGCGRFLEPLYGEAVIGQ